MNGDWSRIAWPGLGGVASKDYRCGYCGNQIATNSGWYGVAPGTSAQVAWIRICHRCDRPTFFDGDKQIPGVVFGTSVADVPNDVQQIYDQARYAAANSYTAAVLCCRKLLMHIAVSKGAKPGETFASYIAYLADNHYVSPDAKGWVNHIKNIGNEANHEIKIMGRPEAEELILFCGMLLKMIFEYPASIQKRIPPP